MIPYLSGSLSINAPFLVSRLDSHIDKCPICASELANLKSADRLLESCGNPSSFTGRSVFTRVNEELEMLEKARLEQTRNMKRAAVGLCCAAVIIFYAIYVFVGGQIGSVINRDNIAGLTTQTDHGSQPIPTPTVSAILGLDHKQDPHQPTTAAVLR